MKNYSSSKVYCFLLIASLLFVIGDNAPAMGFLKNPYDSFPETSVPFPVDSVYAHRYPFGYGDSRIGNYMQDLKIYDNFLLSHETEYSTTDECFGLDIFAKFSIPNSNYAMLFVKASQMEFNSCALFLSDNNGNKVDFLECGSDMSGVVARQFYIDSNYDITIYRLVPDSGDILMEDVGISSTAPVKEFRAHREDKRYRVIEGRFQLLETIVYQSQTYSSRIFFNHTSYALRYRISEGNEIRVSR